jgi:hypothetical protein
MRPFIRREASFKCHIDLNRCRLEDRTRRFNNSAETKPDDTADDYSFRFETENSSAPAPSTLTTDSLLSFCTNTQKIQKILERVFR